MGWTFNQCAACMSNLAMNVPEGQQFSISIVNLEQILACWGWCITRVFVSTHLKKLKSDSAKMTCKIISTSVTKYFGRRFFPVILIYVIHSKANHTQQKLQKETSIFQERDQWPHWLSQILMYLCMNLPMSPFSTQGELAHDLSF